MYGGTNACLQGLRRTMCNEASAAGDSECVFLCSCVHPLSVIPNGVQRFCYINQMLIQRMLGVTLTVGQVAPSSWVMAASLAPGITSALRPPRLALIHLLATCLWSFSHLDIFCFSPNTTSPHLFSGSLLCYTTC